MFSTFLRRSVPILDERNHSLPGPIGPMRILKANVVVGKARKPTVLQVVGAGLDVEVHHRFPDTHKKSDDYGRGRSWLAGVALLFGLIGASSPFDAEAACPTGDPSLLYCEEFTGSNPLSAYNVINPFPGQPPFTMSIVNESLVLTNDSPGLAWAAALYASAFNYRNSFFEADLRFDTQDANLRSVMHIFWGTPTPALDNFISLALQLDERVVVLNLTAAGIHRSRRYAWPNAGPNRTFRVGLKIDEVAGGTPGGPKILALRGYIDGTLIFSETEDSMGVNLSVLPPQLQPSFLGGSYSNSPVNQIFDNALVRRQVSLSCVGFEAPLNAGPVIVKKNRALPFKAMLMDEQGGQITSLGSVPPVIQVTYAPATGNAIDVTDLAVPVGLGTEGNQFVYADGKWQFNLQTKGYTAAGTYTVTMTAGNGYSIEPACTGSFVVK